MQPKLRWALIVVVLVAVIGGASVFLSPREVSEEPTSSTPSEIAVPEVAASESETSAEPTPEVVAEEETAPEEEVVAAPVADTRRDRTGRGRIHGKAAVPAEGPQGLEITIALHRVPAYEATEFTYDKTLAGTTTAAQNGTFEFKSLPLGSYVLLASATGYTINSSATLTVERPERELTLNLVPGGDIQGRVVNQSGEPVVGAHVFVGAWDIQGQKSFAPRDRSLASQSVTDEAGAFKTPNLRTSLNNEPGYKLAVKADGYATFLSDYIRAGTQGVEFILKPGGVVSGMLVKLSDGAALPGKIVTLASELAVENISATTDAEGFFFLTDVPPGKHTAGLRDEDLVLAPETASFDVVDGAAADDVVLQAVEGGRIAGRVYDTDTNQGIAEVTLYAYGTETGGGRRRQVQSGADGTYQVRGLTPGAYRIEFRKPDGYPDARYDDPDRERLVTVDVAKETGGIDFALSRGLTISGRVVDEAGNPLADANVNASASQGNTYDYATTKPDGSFTVAGFSSGQQVGISASKSGYAILPKQPQTGPYKMEDKPITGVELVLGTEARISGIVVDSTGRPKPSIEMYAIRTPNGGSSNSRSAADGTISFDQLTEGEYAMVFTQGGGWSDTQVSRAQKVKVAKGQHLTGVKILYESENEGGLTITGRVLDTKGNGISGANLRLHGPWREITSGAGGNYVIGGLQPGQYTIQAASYAHSGTATKQAEAGAKNVDFVLKGMASISGRVVSTATGQPVTAFRVRASGREGDRYFVRDEFQSVRDAEGRFKLTEVEDGSKNIEVRAENFADAVATIPVVMEGENRENVVVRMEDGAVLVGRVVNGSGKGLSGAQLFIGGVPQQWQMERQRRGVSGSDGSFRITSMPAGQAEISAAHPQFASKTVSLNLVPRIENKVDIVLSAGGTVEGRVTENGRTPLSDVYVYAQLGNDHRQTQTDGDGRYTLAGLPDGPTTLNVHSRVGGSSRSQSAKIDVQDGFVNEVNFDFRANTASIEGTVYGQPGVPVTGETHVNAVVQTAGGTSESYGTQTAHDGTYKIEGLPAGDLSLRVFGNNANKRIALSIADGTRVQKDIFLYGGSTVRIAISGASERSHVMLVTGAVNMNEFSMERIQELYNDMVAQSGIVNGQATLNAVEPGQYTAVAISLNPAALSSSDPYHGAKWGTAAITVQEGKEASAQIDL